jgi:hypothetical protein
MHDKDDSVESDIPVEEEAPLGAVFITSLLAIIILITWFSMFILNFVRS